MTTDIVAEFVTTGTLRVALNHGNRILVGRNTDGTPKGISVDLAKALASDLGVDLTFVEFDRAVDVSNSAEDDLWDVCFLAVDPKRAQTIDFTDPYIRIEGRYLAGAGCTAETADALVTSGAPVGTVEGSAYTLTLARKPGAEHLVTFPDIHAMLAALDAGELHAVAGIGAVMETEAKLRPGARTLQPPFMEILQAMAIVKGRPKATAHLRHFLAELARSGRVGDILEAHGVSRDSAIAPDPA
ncbi:transporter substrate-binding domain-containing protein [Phaeobacter sp. J2-8]|uniref:transporter substrate-binding domain-containing protein n=1 Tax=Phaeobacter sp. J2-8 TaxID=2931394 RepID=UPI001FD4B4A1|nr:transporter substrate-binding domain-containing protein [Phaeobacter sp. J2-8]MCJ7872812.1 transporter substrate-binding domain-containing protein [Phaeobacter sp. J2-8]